MFKRYIKEEVGSVLLSEYAVDISAPRGNGISLNPFFYYDVFKKVKNEFGFALFADNGALWERGINIQHMYKNIIEAVVVEEWSYEWGFKCSIGNNKNPGLY